MTEDHVKADAECAEAIDAARARMEEWREASAAAIIAAGGGDDGTLGSMGWRAAHAERRRCFEAYLVVEAQIRAVRRARVRALDEAQYAAARAAHEAPRG